MMRAASAACAGCVISCWDEASRLMIKGLIPLGRTEVLRYRLQEGGTEVPPYLLIDGCTYPAVSTRADGRKLR
jgi:hypothetical protein